MTAAAHLVDAHGFPADWCATQPDALAPAHHAEHRYRAATDIGHTHADQPHMVWKPGSKGTRATLVKAAGT